MSDYLALFEATLDYVPDDPPDSREGVSPGTAFELLEIRYNAEGNTTIYAYEAALVALFHGVPTPTWAAKVVGRGLHQLLQAGFERSKETVKSDKRIKWRDEDWLGCLGLRQSAKGNGNGHPWFRRYRNDQVALSYEHDESDRIAHHRARKRREALWPGSNRIEDIWASRGHEINVHGRKVVFPGPKRK